MNIYIYIYRESREIKIFCLHIYIYIYTHTHSLIYLLMYKYIYVDHNKSVFMHGRFVRKLKSPDRLLLFKRKGYRTLSANMWRWCHCRFSLGTIGRGKTLFSRVSRMHPVISNLLALATSNRVTCSMWINVVFSFFFLLLCQLETIGFDSWAYG